MSSYVNRYLTQPGTAVTSLSAWDGRPTSALIRSPDSSSVELL